MAYEKEGRMKRAGAFIVLLLVVFATNVWGEKCDSVLGTWYNEEKTSAIEIFRCADAYCGKIVWLKNPQDAQGKEKVDLKNPDESLRARKIMGLQILSGFRYAGDETWEAGKIYDPKNGKTYSCKIRLEGENLKIRGFIGISLFGRTTVWTRKL
jgi:uncharacterized protein (DUF2147 family)